MSVGQLSFFRNEEKLFPKGALLLLNLVCLFSEKFFEI